MRVLIVDDHTLFRSGLQELLQHRGIEVADAMGDGEEGIRMAACLEPDIILLDIRMPKMDGLTVLKRIRDLKITTPIAMLSTSREEWDVVRSLRYGAQGYLLKDMEPDDLVVALTDIIEGKTVVAPELASVLAKVVQGDMPGSQGTVPFSELTPRESEILCHLAEGQSNKVIARELGISDGTVKLHVKAILRKLSVHSRVEAAVIAVEQGLCEKT
jgi:two-component system nitrate/nitrite response regulator NarL